MTPDDFQRRLEQRTDAFGLGLTPSQLAGLERYYELLSRWSRKINLTALPLRGNPDRTLDRLFIEPLMAAASVEDVPHCWFDLGSGSGSPAIPLKIVRPHVRLTMVESRTRKAAFLREVIRALELKDADVRIARIEALPEEGGLRGKLDLITVRAVRIDEVLLACSAALLRPSGRLFLFGSADGLPAFGGLEPVEKRLLAGGDSALHVFRRASNG